MPRKARLDAPDLLKNIAGQPRFSSGDLSSGSKPVRKGGVLSSPLCSNELKLYFCHPPMKYGGFLTA